MAVPLRGLVFVSGTQQTRLDKEDPACAGKVSLDKVLRRLSPQRDYQQHGVDPVSLINHWP